MPFTDQANARFLGAHTIVIRGRRLFRTMPCRSNFTTTILTLLCLT